MVAAQIERLEFKTQDEWLAERRKSIGASQVGSILGVNKWETPLQLYLRMKGELEWPDLNERMRIGLAMEQGIAQLLAEDLQRTVHLCGRTLYRNRECPWVHATPDSWMGCDLDPVVTAADARRWPIPIIPLLSDTLGELKSMGERYFDSPEGPGSTGEPLHAHQAQLQAQMLVTGCKRGIIAILVGSRELKVYEIDADEEVQRHIAKATQEFMEVNVALGIPPPATGLDVATLRKRWPVHKAGKVIELRLPVYKQFADQYELLQASVKLGEAKLADLKAKLQAEMADAEEAVLPDGRRFTWRSHDVKAETKLRVARVDRPFKLLKAPKNGR